MIRRLFDSVPQKLHHLSRPARQQARPGLFDARRNQKGRIFDSRSGPCCKFRLEAVVREPRCPQQLERRNLFAAVKSP